MRKVIITIRPNKKGASYKQKPRLLGCRYLSVRRGIRCSKPQGREL
jgi:hypothetical protein